MHEKFGLLPFLDHWITEISHPDGIPVNLIQFCTIDIEIRYSYTPYSGLKAIESIITCSYK